VRVDSRDRLERRIRQLDRRYTWIALRGVALIVVLVTAIGYVAYKSGHV